MPGTRRSKRDKLSKTLRRHLADNVSGLRDIKYGSEMSETARNKALAREADISLSQVQRIINCELGASIDYLEALAKALETRPQDLVTPYFASRFSSEPIPLRPRTR